MPIKAVIFDMDGVLIDAREWHYESLNRALSLFGADIPRYDHLAQYDGLPTRKKLELLSRETGFPVGLHGFVNELKQRYTLEIAYTRCKPVFQHRLALSLLRANGYRLALCSNSVRDSIELMMRKAALASYLELMLSNEDVVRPKPDPSIYLTAIARLGLQPADCLVVEDNEYGVKAALDSGAHLLRVRDPGDVDYERIAQRIQEIDRA